MDKPAIAYTPRTDATPETDLSTLASIYRFVLHCHKRKEAAPESRPDDARKDQDAGTNSNCT